MRRHAPSSNSPDDSDASFVQESDDDFSDIVDEPSDHDTELTDVDDLSTHKPDDLEADVDLEDQVQLFEGNLHPPEHYRQALEEFNEEAYEGQDYSPGTILLLDATEERWHEYAAYTSRVTRTNMVS